MSSLLSRAGFNLPAVDVDEITINYPSIFELVDDLRYMGESNAVGMRRPHLKRDTLLAADAIYRGAYPECLPVAHHINEPFGYSAAW